MSQEWGYLTQWEERERRHDQLIKDILEAQAAATAARERFRLAEEALAKYLDKLLAELETARLAIAAVKAYHSNQKGTA